MTPEDKDYYGNLSGIWSSSLNANHKMTDEQSRIQELEATEATLRAELLHFTQSGIVEIAVRNPSVAEYMVHWEQRAARAEAENARLREAIDYILDGMGISYPDYKIDAQDDYADAANSKWVKDTLARLAALLRAKP